MFADLALEAPDIDWWDMPMDAVYARHERLRAREERAFARGLMTGQLGLMAMGGKAEQIRQVVESGQKYGTNQPYEYLDGDVLEGMPTPAIPYPIPPAVARGLGLAMDLGLLIEAPWASWPFTPEGLPLPRIWDRIEAAKS